MEPLQLFAKRPGHRSNLHRQVLDTLVDGEELTVISALQKFRTIELRKIVSDLRAVGIPISDRWHKNPSTKKRFKIYFIQNKK
ncbi:MAG: helix-turn-helix domain-containing protein [Patescibacteria group bacterium]